MFTTFKRENVFNYFDREWHNTHEDLHRPVRGDAHNIRPNTIVHLDEFHTLIQEALMVASASSKDEL